MSGIREFGDVLVCRKYGVHHSYLCFMMLLLAQYSLSLARALFERCSWFRSDRVSHFDSALSSVARSFWDMTRPLCQRCWKHRPARQVRCLGCSKRIGPGCKTEKCLLVEFHEASKTKYGLCTDWPHCEENSRLTLMQILVTASKSLDEDVSDLT